MHHKVLDHQLKNKGAKHPKHQCFVCNKSMHLNSWLSHTESVKHRGNLELMKASIAHNGSWNDPPQQKQKHNPRPSGRPQSRPKSLPNSRSGSSERCNFSFRAAAWQEQSEPRPPVTSTPPPPHNFRGNLPSRAFSPADSDESERRRQKDRAETEALLRRAQAMQETFRRDRERHRSQQPNLGRANDELKIRQGITAQPSDRRMKIFEKSNASEKRHSTLNTPDPVRGSFERPLTKNVVAPTNPDSTRESESLVSRLNAMSRTGNSSVLSSLSSSSLPVRPTPTPPPASSGRSAAQNPFEAPNVPPKVSSSEFKARLPDVSKLGLSGVTSQTRESAAVGERRTASSSALLNVINSPRGRRERRQLEELLRTLPQSTGPTRRPRLNPALSPAMLRSVVQHEEGIEKLPTLDLSIEEATSAVTSLSTTAREEISEQLSEETPRSVASVASLVSPVAKKRKTGQMEVEGTEEEETESHQSKEPLSEEVSRMQLALQLSVQQQAIHRKVEVLNTDLSEQYIQLEGLQRKIEGMELELSKLRQQETDIHQRRMDVLKKSYLKPFGSKSSESSVTSASEGLSSRVDSSMSNAGLAPSITSSDSQTGTVVAAAPLKLKQEVETITDDADGEEPLIGNLTAREIRERAMAMIGEGAMNFADLDDVLSELMVTVSGDITEELQLEPQPETPEEVPRSGKKRRRKSEGSGEAESSSERRVESDSVVSDVMSARPAITGSSKKDASEKSSRKSASSLSDDNSSGPSSAPIPTFAGAIEAHNGPVTSLQLFRNSLYSCSEDASVKKFSPQSHECLKQFSGFSDSVRCLLVTEKPKGIPRIFSGGDEKVLLVHDTRSGNELQRLSLEAQITCMQLHWFSLFVGLSSGALLAYDVRRNAVSRTKLISDHPVRLVEYARKESRGVLIVATSNGTLWLLDLSLNANPQQLLPPSRGGERPMQLQSVGDRLLFVTDAGRLRYLSLTAGAASGAEDVSADICAKVCCLLAPTHTRHLLVGCRDGSIRLLDREDLTQVVKVYYTPGRYALTALTTNFHGTTGSIFAGNKNGQLLVIHVSNTSIACEFGDCKLSFGSRDDLVYHVTREHVMSASESDVPCLWAKTCKHRYDRTRSEDISVHVRLHV